MAKKRAASKPDYARSSRSKAIPMGVIPRESGENFIITSDRVFGEAPSRQAPRKRISDIFQVWTGDAWSSSLEAAINFSTLDTADDYIQANIDRLIA